MSTCGFVYPIMLAISLCFAFCANTYGIILHPNGEPPSTWTDKPVDTIVGRWSTNASFVVVAPKWIITTRHQNTNPSTVNINGVTYNCIYSPDWIGGSSGSADIRLIRLKKLDGSDPNLAYAPPYTDTDEINKSIRIGGWGRLRGAELQTRVGNTYYTYGYLWDPGTNTSQRWCTNIIDGNGIVNDGTRISNVITAHFNDQGTTSPATQYEGIAAEYDSGGGWFIKIGAVWKVAGLSRGIGYHGTWPNAVESWYRNPSDPRISDPDPMDAVRISSYATWIQGVINVDCTSADLTGDCRVDFADLNSLATKWLNDCNPSNNWCGGADLNTDDIVDFLDFAIMASNWLDEVI